MIEEIKKYIITGPVDYFTKHILRVYSNNRKNTERGILTVTDTTSKGIYLIKLYNKINYKKFDFFWTNFMNSLSVTSSSTN